MWRQKLAYHAGMQGRVHRCEGVDGVCKDCKGGKVVHPEASKRGFFWENPFF